MLTLVAKFGDDTAFDPDTVQIMAAAYDHAWAALKASGAPFSTDDYAETAREIIGKYIIEAAKTGERDKRTLADDALLHLSKSGLRRLRKPRERPVTAIADLL